MALGDNIKRDKLIPNNKKPFFEEETEDSLLHFFERNRTEIKLEPKKETPLYKSDNQVVKQNIKQNTNQIFISKDDFSELNLFATELLSQSNFIKKNLTEITEDLSEISSENLAENSPESSFSEEFGNNFGDNFGNSFSNIDKNIDKNILQNLEQNEKEITNTNRAFSLLEETKLKTLTSAENAEKSLDTFISGISEVQKTSRILTEISAQSGVLAINSAIEAARAGDSGRSFVVIADEIRKISDNAKKSSDNIEDTLRGLQKDMQMALKALFQMKNYLENQEFAINQLSQNLENITQNNANMVDMIKENQKENQKVDKKEKASFNIEKEISKNIEKSTKNSKKNQIITEKLENINHTAQNLHSIAKQLHENLKNMS